MIERVELIELRSQGKTYQEIATLLDISKQRVYQLMQELDVPDSLFGRIQHLRPIDPKPVINPKRNLIKNWPQPLYWLWRKLQTYSILSKDEKLLLFEHLRTDLPLKCPVLGITLKYCINTPRTDNSASLDRVDNSIGYVPSNVHVISWKANRIKDSGTAKDHELISEYIRKHVLE